MSGLVLVIVALEYLARHFLLFWLPALSSRRVNDMLMAGLVYLALVWLTIPSERRNLADLPRALGEILATARRPLVWIAALAAIAATIGLAFVDAALWGDVRLPSAISPWRWEATVLAAAAPLLVPAILLLMNGVVVPMAEERLWRGLIQPRLVDVLGLATGLVVTSVLFSLKHVVIDASPARLLGLAAFGLVMGMLAARQGWRASALAHALANISATALALLASGGQA